jgi:hypothetical protein
VGNPWVPASDALHEAGIPAGATRRAIMLCRHEIVRGLGDEERRFVERCQILAVFLFLAILAAVVLWTAVAPDDPPQADAVPVIAVQAAGADADDHPRAP